MRNAVLFIALILAAPARAQFDAPHPPPDWMERGFEAAIADPSSIQGALGSSGFWELAEFVPSARAGAVIDKLLPFLGDEDRDLQRAAEESLARIAAGGQAAVVIDKLLPLLGDLRRDLRHAAAEALGQIAPGERAGMVIDRLLPLLGDDFDPVRGIALYAAVQTVGEIAPGERAGAAMNKLLPLLGNKHGYVREAAAESLARIAAGGRAGAVIDKLLPLLGDEDRDVRHAAAEALGRIAVGEPANAVTDKLLPLLGNRDGQVRLAAAKALGGIALLGERANAVSDKLLPLLGDPDGQVRLAAAEALVRIASAEGVGVVIDKLLPLLRDQDRYVQDAVAEALGRIAVGERANAVTDRLLPLLGDRDLRRAAAEALGRIAPRDRAAEVIDKLLPLLGDDPDDGRVFNRDAAAEALGRIATDERAGVAIDKLLPLLNQGSNIRRATAQALGQIAPGEHAGAVIDKLLPLLDEGDRDLRYAVAEALGRIAPAERAGVVIDKLLPLLRGEDRLVRAAAAEALGRIAPRERAGVVIDKLLPLLGDDYEDGRGIARRAAAKAIGQIGPAGLSATVIAVRLINSHGEDATGLFRAAAHVATGADTKKEGSELLLAWLGRPAALPRDSVANNPTQAQRVLQLLTDNWAALSSVPRAREEAENAAMAVIEAACRTPTETSSLAEFARASIAWLRDLPIEGPVHRCWTPEQKRTVEALLADFKESHSTHENPLAAHLKGEDFAPIGLWLTRSLVIWTLFWIAFLAAFPWSRTIQAIFFWNPRARQFFSAGFVPLLLLILPPLRRRLLAPFHEDLLAQARLEDLAKLGYFADGRGRVNSGEPIRLSQLWSRLSGVVVLQADSGLGKTSFLREVAAKATRPVAFLHARDCTDGVDVAISRIIHDVQETGFVRSLVHTRALTVIVDGLNEVGADTREKVGAFARDMSKGDVIVATQPIEWRPPPNSCTVELLPLDRSEAMAFIESRPVGADPHQPCHGPDYEAAVQKFVSRALDQAPSQLERETAALMLSNPFDLTFAAELLARGRMPSPTALVDEAFRLADERYRAIAKVAFPLEAFGQHAVKMRLEDRNWLTPDEFPGEASSLLDQRLLVLRAMKDAQGVADRPLFRHDRVWDFFIAAAFAQDPDLWAEHVRDARFRGAYLRIAETWDPEDAKKVRDLLNVAAADSGDHSTSDEFIKRLEKRFRAKKRPLAPAVERRA